MFEELNPTEIMKHLFPALVYFFFSCFFSFCSAQIVSKGYSAPVMQAFLKGETYVVLTNDDSFDEWLRSTMGKQWTVSQVQFITPVQLDSLVVSDKIFFLYAQAKDEKTGAARLLNSDDLAKKKEYYIVLSQGGYKQSKLLFAAGTTGSKVIGSFRYGPDRAELAAGMFECEMMFCLLNQSLQIVMERKVKSVVKDSVKWVITDENAGLIRDKTLLINRAYYDGAISLEEKPLVIDKVLDDYPYDYLIVGKDSATLMFDDPSEDYCYLFFYFPSPRLKVSEDSGDILVYDPLQKKMLYFEDNINGPWFEKWKMKQMLTFIKRK